MSEILIVALQIINELSVGPITIVFDLIISLLKSRSPLSVLLVITMQINAGLDICSRNWETKEIQR